MALITEQLVSTIVGSHPACKMPFDELYAGLMQEVANENVYIVQHPTEDLQLFSYTIKAQFDNLWNVFSLISRGLIVSPGQKRVVAVPFPKFFNSGEYGFPLPNIPFTVSEKYDGSLGIIFFWAGNWHCATRGSFFSDQCKYGEKWLHENVDLTRLNKDVTYLAEIIFPSNRIVVSYDFEGLVLIGAYDNINGHEIASYALPYAKGFYHKKYHKFETIDSILKLCESLPPSQEGFVVEFDNGLRAKIKGAEYIRLHRLVSNVTPTRIWECLLENDNLEKFRMELSEEIKKDFDNIINLLNKKFEDTIIELKAAHEKTKNLTDKELGLAIKNGTLGESETIRRMLFLCRKNNLLTEAYVGGSGMRKKVFNSFYPKGNKLPGYVPCTYINRFVDDG